MAALARLVLILVVVLTVIYVSLSFYARRVERDRLEKVFADEDHAGDREAFVRAGLENYEKSLQRKLLIGVYVVPICAIAVIIYVTNTV